jgi:hypothetical protein
MFGLLCAPAGERAPEMIRTRDATRKPLMEFIEIII